MNAERSAREPASRFSTARPDELTRFVWRRALQPSRLSTVLQALLFAAICLVLVFSVLLPGDPFREPSRAYLYLHQAISIGPLIATLWLVAEFWWHGSFSPQIRDLSVVPNGPLRFVRAKLQIIRTVALLITFLLISLQVGLFWAGGAPIERAIFYYSGLDGLLSAWASPLIVLTLALRFARPVRGILVAGLLLLPLHYNFFLQSLRFFGIYDLLNLYWPLRTATYGAIVAVYTAAALYLPRAVAHWQRRHILEKRTDDGTSSQPA